ncbi:hypothetical protein MAR_000678 [Mya arenaria]|uniref:Uncharacterized protein n=1 Tax=Mya arenaria TaxID=6604 RepID=A0ABY7F9P8_MYAAR|nr:hypothetical protein MAR_000678 [Mya arenaria]
MYDIIVLIEIFLIGFAVEGESVPFCLLFSIEILLKVYTFGPKQFDVAITSLALVFLVIGSAYSPKDYILHLRYHRVGIVQGQN